MHRTRETKPAGSEHTRSLTRRTNVIRTATIEKRILLDWLFPGPRRPSHSWRPNALAVALVHIHMVVSNIVAFLIDPWGTYIEVTEKLAPQ
jgi:hypothetical protein